jgi:uncharacterized protein (DUF697 family)
LETNKPYQKIIRRELYEWEREMTKESSLSKRLSKAIQTGIHSLTPKKVENIITASYKTAINTVISGSCWLTKTSIHVHPSLAESDGMVRRVYQTYYKIAVAQGIGFGLGGFFINLADLPALMTTQVKFLFDCCKLYGFNPDKESERLFIIYVFQLAYSSNERRAKILHMIRDWDFYAKDLEPDWEKLQLEYRDYMDIAKILQLLPVVGAVAGAAANHNLMGTLKKTAMNAYRLRILNSEKSLKQEMRTFSK